MIRSPAKWPLCLLLMAPTLGQGEPIEYSGFVRSEVSDNIRQATLNEESDISISVGATATKSGEQGKAGYQMRLAVSAYRYLEKTYGDRLNGSGTLQAHWRPDAWWDLGLSNTLTQERLDLTQVENPDNTTRRNVVTASAARIIAPQSGWPTRISLSHIRTDFSKAENRDSARNRVGLGMSHAISSLTQVSLEANSEKTDFDTEAENRRHSLSIGFQRQLPKGLAHFNVGTVRLESEDQLSQSTTYTGISLGAGLTYAPHERMQWALSLDHSLDDTSSDRVVLSEADELLSLQDTTAARVTRVLATSTAYLGKAQTVSGRLGYSRQVDLEPRNASERYSFGTGYTLAWSTQISVGTDVSIEHNASLNGLDSTLFSGSVWYRRVLSRNWSVLSRLTHRQRSHELSFNEWDENRIMVSLEWTAQ